jgi:hypothetical protein
VSSSISLTLRYLRDNINPVRRYVMATVNLSLIQEIDCLWSPVYPYLAEQVLELYGRRDGSILEIGPFCGVIFSLMKKNIGSSFSIATFPSGMDLFFREEARKEGIEGRIEVIGTDPALTGVMEDRFNLAIFRGAFFFPSLFRVNFSAIHRVLRPNGMAFIGGGFGKFTPESVIKSIGERSRDLNLQIGKIEVTEDQLRKDIEASRVKGKTEIISEGGLWVVLRKEAKS